MSDKVRTRFAPSPTGYMHIGNLRTALYAYLIAKNNDGDFILRIEDTDLERYVEGATEVIYETLKETNLNWDEGPDIGGKYAPYIQSKRKNNYLDYAEQLIKNDQAYYCFCSKERLSSLDEDENGIHKYDGHCRELSDEEIKENLKQNKPFVIRQKMPLEGYTEYKDMVYGTVSIENSELEDQILIKSDGMPTYNFANVIDDHLMNITHVVRGNEYLVSTPKYILLYLAFNWKIPKYIHLPLIMKSNTEKLSKRTGSASYADLKKEGYLPEAIINYIALLGWSPKGNREIFSLEELTKEFDIKRINKSQSIFDKDKLTWMNEQYIKNMSLKDFTEYAKPYYDKVIKNSSYEYDKISKTLKTRISTFEDIPDMINFYGGIDNYDITIYRHKRMKTDENNSLEFLIKLKEALLELDDFTNDSIYQKIVSVAKENGYKNGQVIWPLRTALTGVQVSPGGATEVAEILGKDETIKRIDFGINLLKKS